MLLLSLTGCDCDVMTNLLSLLIETEKDVVYS